MMNAALQTAIRHYEAGQFEEAARRLEALLHTAPEDADAVYYFGLAAQAMGQHRDAIGLLQKAIAINPAAAQFHTSLGNVYYDTGQTQAALDAWNKTLELNPNDPAANERLGRLYSTMGDVPRALACLRRALEADPQQPAVRSALLYLLYHDPQADDFVLYAEHLEYQRQHAAALGTAAPYRQEFRADRPLRIGYMCPDFHAPAVACFIAPLLKSHRHTDYQITLYSAANGTSQPHASPHTVRSIAGLNDAAVADLIRRDQMDILVDLAVHSADNRMLVLARQPAPLQVSYLPYPGATGLAHVNYRITDVLLDPHGSHLDFRIENLVRLPAAYICYLPPSDTTVTSLPPGPIRLGCSCQLMQLNDGVLRTWAEILEQVPDARLCMEAPKLDDPVVAGGFMERCAAAGIGATRLELQPYVDPGTAAQRLSTLHIALDPFPFNTMASACNALWMGLPLITLPGKAAPGRFGLSLLTHAGLRQWVAPDAATYVKLAVGLARDPARLATQRATLRQTLTDSGLTDGKSFTRNLEGAYHEMWRRRCAAQTSRHGQ